MGKSINIAVIGTECVSCGTCVTACPMTALHIYKGIIAKIDTEKCIGCGKCSKVCPADVISIVKRGDTL